MNNLPDSMYDYRPQMNNPRQIEVCSDCGWGIYTGDDYWLIDNKIYCKECINRLRKVGEEE